MRIALVMDSGVLGHSRGGVHEQTAAQRARVEHGAFERVYDAHVDFVWRALRHLGVLPAHLDDAVQEVFMVVHRRLVEFEGRSSLRTWIYGIAIGVARNARRSARRHEHVEPIEPWLDDVRASAHPAERAEARDLVTEALERVEDGRREVLVLADVEELTAPEIAEALAIPLGTVYSRLRIARREFESAVRALEDVDFGKEAP